MSGVQRGGGRGHGQRAGAVVVGLGKRAKVRRGQAGQVAAVQADIRRSEIVQSCGIGQSQAGHIGHGQGVHNEPGRRSRSGSSSTPRVRCGGGRGRI